MIQEAVCMTQRSCAVAARQKRGYTSILHVLFVRGSRAVYRMWFVGVADVDLLGYIPNPLPYMAKADLFLLSSRWASLDLDLDLVLCFLGLSFEAEALLT